MIKIRIYTSIRFCFDVPSVNDPPTASTTTLLQTKRTIETTPLTEQAYTPAYNVTVLLVFGAVIMLAIVVFVTLKRTRGMLISIYLATFTSVNKKTI